jgi:hypothetical protein
MANERGGPDNITVLIARFDGQELQEPGDEDEVGHRVYPLLDPDADTQPVPVYKGTTAPLPQDRARMALAGLLAAAITAAALLFVASGI